MNQVFFEDFDTNLESIPGFLFPIAAYGTSWLLSHQIAVGLHGGLLEIGVFRGKYFSLLARSAQEGQQRLLGIDSFVYSPESAVHDAVASHPSTASTEYEIIPRSSNEVSREEIVTALGGLARFVSVDGSHDASDVYYDLILTNEILSEHGIVAIDDFLNPRALGVGEATHRFLRGQCTLVPFALFGNKLFACRMSHRDRYQAEIKAFFRASPLPEGKAFCELDQLGPEHVEQRLCGETVIVM